MKKNIFLFITMVLFTTSIVAQSPWTRAKGEGFMHLSVNAITYNKVYFNKIATKINYDVSDYTVSLYGEYGITNDFTLIGEIPFKIISAEFPNINKVNNSDFSNVSLAGKYSLFNQGISVAAQAKVDFSTAYVDNVKRYYTGEPTYKLTPSLIVGWSNAKMFIGTELGYAMRPAFYNDLIFNAQIGYKLFNDKLTIMIPYQYRAVKDGTAALKWANDTKTYLYSSATQYSAFGLKLFYKYNLKSAISFAFMGGSGDFIAAAPSINLGFSRFLGPSTQPTE
jgi:hypothetical protein